MKNLVKNKFQRRRERTPRTFDEENVIFFSFNILLLLVTTYSYLCVYGDSDNTESWVGAPGDALDQSAHLQGLKAPPGAHLPYLDQQRNSHAARVKSKPFPSVCM